MTGFKKEKCKQKIPTKFNAKVDTNLHTKYHTKAKQQTFINIYHFLSGLESTRN